MTKINELKLVIINLNPGTLSTKTLSNKNIFPRLAKRLESMCKEVNVILNTDIPQYALEAASASGSEVKKVEINGYAPTTIKMTQNHYIVTYQTIRGRQLGCCMDFYSDDLKK